MLAPHELKNKEFTKSLRGYSTEEVDEHIAFIIEKYTELYRENDALEKKLKVTEAKLDEMKAEEDSIRSALINAQKASKTIIDDANEQADVIMRSAKTNCDRLIAELQNNVALENDRLNAVKEEVAAFKAVLFEGYRKHIEMIEGIAPETNEGEISAERAEELSKIVVDRIRDDLSKFNHITTGKNSPFEEEEETEVTSDDISTPAEVIIPENIEEADKPKIVTVRDEDQLSFEEIAQADETAEEESGYEEETISINESGSIIDSIKKLNSEVNKNTRDDDEEFLRLLRMASGNGDMTSTEAFEMVYDGKRTD